MKFSDLPKDAPLGRGRAGPGTQDFKSRVLPADGEGLWVCGKHPEGPKLSGGCCISLASSAEVVWPRERQAFYSGLSCPTTRTSAYSLRTEEREGTDAGQSFWRPSSARYKLGPGNLVTFSELQFLSVNAGVELDR